MRLAVYDNAGAYAFDIAEADVFECVRTEELNGEHSLSLTTTARLSQGQRILTRDGAGTWREHVVLGVDELHDSGLSAMGTYHCVWSLQYDLSTVYGSYQYPGQGGPVSPAVALRMALDGTARWQVGDVTVTDGCSVEMVGGSAWERVAMVVEEVGGEVGSEVDVGPQGVISRKVSLLAHEGSQEASRRFDWGRDVASIRRKPQELPLCCRIIPKGKSDIGIEDVNGGVPWVEDAQAAAACRIPDGNGGWEYPTRVVKLDIDDDRELLAHAREHVAEYTRPVPTYEADVVQYAAAGMDAKGLALGDVVHIVDSGFNPNAPLRLEARVVKMATNELDPSDVKVTVGQVGSTFADRFRTITARMGEAQAKLDAMWSGSGGSPSTADYLGWLLDRLNQEVNATGGWTYITQGQGIRTYNAQVSDPLVGAEASSVVEIRGGNIRIADSRTPDGDWDWKTLMQSGHIATELVTAGRITSGFIGSPGGNYWNLDTGELHMANVAYMDRDGNEVPFTDFVDLARSGMDTAVAANELIREQAVKVEDAQERARKAYERQVGSANLLHDTATMGSWRMNQKSDTEKWTVVNRMKTDNPLDHNVAQWSGFSSVDRVDWSAPLRSPSGKLRIVDLQERRVTLSMYARCTKSGGMGAVTQDNCLVVSICACDADGTRRLWRDVRIDEPLPTKEGRRITMSFTCEKSFFPGGSYAGDYIGGLYLEVWVFARTVAGVEIDRCQLEFGDVATDWHAKSVDLEKAAARLADAAYEASRVYTNAISAKDREYTAEQKQALDESLTQREILKRLTDGFRAKGIFMENGELYVNGTYVRTGTLDAGIVKAGILTDQAGENQWNMQTGYFKTHKAEMEDANVTGTFATGDSKRIVLSNGLISGYKPNNERAGWIGVTTQMLDKDTGRVYDGIQIQGGVLRISTSLISVLNSTSVGETTKHGFTGKVNMPVVESVRLNPNGGGTVTTTNHGIRCINGIVVAAW